MSDTEEKSGFFENVLMILGAWTGGAFGYEHGEWLGLIIGALILGAIGKAVGQLADWLLKLVVTLVILLINNVTRRIIWEFLKGIFQVE